MCLYLEMRHVMQMLLGGVTSEYASAVLYVLEVAVTIAVSN